MNNGSEVVPWPTNFFCILSALFPNKNPYRTTNFCIFSYNISSEKKMIFIMR
jgi:hypothetical protein